MNILGKNYNFEFFARCVEISGRVCRFSSFSSLLFVSMTDNHCFVLLFSFLNVKLQQEQGASASFTRGDGEEQEEILQDSWQRC